MITNDARCTREIKSRIVMAKSLLNKQNNLDLNLHKKLVKCYTWRTGLYGTENWTMREVDPKYLETFATWCWRRMEKISRTDRV
jgi:hypothetical protein